jgi:hypothetical protein
MAKHDLMITDTFKKEPEYNQATPDLNIEIKQYNIKGNGCYKKATHNDINLT